MADRSLSRMTLLWISYTGLVLVTAWSAWNTDRALNRIEDDVCAAIEVTLFDTVVVLDVVSEAEGVDRDEVVALIDPILELAAAVEERCGATFLDDVGDG